MIKVIQVTDEMRRIRLANQLIIAGVSRMADGRYVEELSLDELRSELRKVKVNEILRATKERT